MTRDELVATIRTERARLDAAVAGLSEAQRVSPALDNHWSVKDVLAHISAWERTCTGWLEAIARGATPQRPEVEDVDETNARFYAGARDATLAVVLADSQASHDALIAVAMRLTDAQLNDTRPLGFELWHMVDGNSAEHYREHAEQIETEYSVRERG